METKRDAFSRACEPPKGSRLARFDLEALEARVLLAAAPVDANTEALQGVPAPDQAIEVIFEGAEVSSDALSQAENLTFNPAEIIDNIFEGLEQDSLLSASDASSRVDISALAANSFTVTAISGASQAQVDSFLSGGGSTPLAFVGTFLVRGETITGSFVLQNVTTTDGDSGIAVQAEDASVTFGGFGAGVTLSEASGAFFITGGGIAGELSGSVNLAGFSDLTLADNMKVVFNTTGQPVNESFNVGGSTTTLSIANPNFMQMEGRITLGLSGFAHLTGDFVLPQVTTDTVTLTNGDTVSVLALNISGSNIHAFAGFNGPYWNDVNNDGVQDASEINDSAFGFALDGAKFGLTLMMGVTGRFHAAKIEADSIKTVGMDEVEISASDIVIQVNGGGDPLRNPLAPPVVDFSGDPLILGSAGNPISIDFEDTIFSASIGNAKLLLGDFIHIEGGFTFQKGVPVEVSVDGDLKEVDLMSVGASGVRAFAGVGGSYFEDLDGNGNGFNDRSIGFVLDNVNLAIAMMEGSEITDFSSYFAAKIEAQTAQIVGLGDIFSLSFSGITFGVNTADHPLETALTPEEAIDFAATGGLAIPAGNSEVVLDFDGEIIEASVDLAELKISQFVQIQGSFAFQNGGSIEAPLDNGDSEEVDVLLVGASRVRAFVGVGGPYWTPAGTNNEAMGFVLEDVALGLLIGESSSLFDYSSYFALKVSADSARAVGFGDLFKLEISGIELGINEGSNPTATRFNPAPAIDFSSMDGGKLVIPTGAKTEIAGAGAVTEVALDFEGAILEASIDFANLQIANFIQIQGSLSIEKGRSIDVPVGDDTKEVEAFLIGGSGLRVFAGVGGPYWDENGVVNTDALGFVLDGVDVGVAMLEATSLTDPSKYMAVKVNADHAGLVGFGDILKVEVKGLEVGLNQVEDWSTPDFLLEAVDFSAIENEDGSNGLKIKTGAVSEVPGAGPRSEFVTLDYSEAITRVTVEEATLQIYKFIYLTGSFAFEKGRTLRVPTEEGQDPEDWKEVETLTIGASDVHAFVGWDGPYWKRNVDGSIVADPTSKAIGLALQDLDFGLAIFEPTNPLDAYEYMAMKATAQSVSFVGLGEHFQLSGENISVSLNQGSSPLVLDMFETPIYFPGLEGGGFEVETGGAPVLLDFDDAYLSISVERATLQISQFVYLTGSFQFEKGKTTEVPVGSEGDLEWKEVETMTIGASNVYAFVGWGGPYWTRNNAGEVIVDPNNEAIGLALEDLDFGMALFEPTNPFDDVSYRALKASAESIAFVGLEDDFELSGKNITLSLNEATALIELGGLLGPDPIYFPALNDGLGFEVPTGDDSVYLDYDDAFVGVSVEQATLKISKFVYLTGSFEFQKGKTVELPTTGGDMVEVETMTIGASNVYAFVGWNGPYWVRDQNGNISADEDSGAIGLALEDLDVGVGIFEPTNIFDATSYFALSASAGSIEFVGLGDDFQLSGRGITVGLNQVSHPLENPLWAPDAINFAEVDDGAGFAIPTGQDPVYLNFEDAVIEVAVEQAVLGIGGFVHLQGSFAFTKGNAYDITLSSFGFAGRETELEFLTIGASDVQAFVGVNGPYRSDTNNDGVINGSDTVNSSAVGFVLDNLDLGVAIMTPTNPIDPSRYYAVSISADNAGLIGIDGIEISAKDLAVELNIGKVIGNPLNPPVVDFVASFPDPDGNGPETAGYKVPTGAVTIVDGMETPITVTLDMESHYIRAASSKVVIDILGVLNLVGGIEITKGAVYDVQLTNGQHKEVTSLTIAGIDLFGFIGANGPYWADRNGDGIITTNPSSPIYDAPDADAIGLSINDVTIGAALFIPTNLLDPARYLAIKGEIGGVDVVGLDFLTATFRDIKLDLNLGVGLTSGLSAIDFTKGDFAASANNGQAGLVLDTGGDTIVIDFSEVFIQAQLAGKVGLKIPGTNTQLLEISGAFVFSVTTGSISLFADGSVKLGVPGGDALNLHGRAVFVLNEEGFAADVSLTLSFGGDLASTFSNTSTARLRVNTSGLNQSVTVPASYVQFLAPETQAALITNADGTKAFVIPKGAPQLNGSIGAPGVYLVINAAAEISVAGSLVLQANLWFEASGEKLDMMMAAAMGLGPIGSANIVGNLQISSEGLVASLDATLQTAPNIAAALGITISGRFKVELNTKAAAAEISRPVVNKRTGTFTDEIETVTIEGRTVRVFGAGTLSFVNSFELKTQFEFTGNSNGIVIGVDGYLKVGFIGEIAVQAGLAVRNDGIVARIDISAGVGNDFGGGAGVKITGTFTLEINTTGHNATLPVGMSLGARATTIAPGILIRITGSIEFLGFATASGKLEIAFRNNELRIDIDATLVLGPLDVHVDGFGIFRSGGIVLSVNVSVEADVLSIVEFEASGQLRINTTDSSVNGIPANSFRLHLNGELTILKIFSMDASFTMNVRNGAWKIEFSAGMSFFGLATLDADGWIDSNGHFEVNFYGEIVLGSRSNGLVGAVSFKVWFTGDVGEEDFGIWGRGEVSARLFGFKLAGVALEFEFSAKRTKGGDERIKVVASVTIEIEFLFWTFRKSASFTLGYIRIPKPVYLGGLASQPEEWVGADQGGNGTLYLNVGDRANWRNLEEDDASETYIIEHVAGSASDPEGETINVTAWGRKQRFTGVKKIVGDFSNGDDFILVGDGVTAPVELEGGSGDDQLIYEGTSLSGRTSTISGGSGNDLIILTDAFLGNAVIYGGSGDDRIEGSGRADVIHGDSGDDQIFGNGGNDEIYEWSGTNIIVGGMGNDTIHGGSGRDIIAGDNIDFEWELGVPVYFAKSVNSGQGGNDTLFGHDGADFLIGGAGADFLSGGSGDDLLAGDEGYLEFSFDRNTGANEAAKFESTSAAGAGDDLYADDGNDILVGGVGADLLAGWNGADLIIGDNATVHYFWGAWNNATTHDFVGSGDTIYGDADNDMILGGEGVDAFFAGSGHDLVFGDNGRITRTNHGLLNSAESYNGPSTNETLNGDDGNDILVGSGGVDTLAGHAGNDILVSSGASIDYSNGVLVRVTSSDQDGAQSETLYGDIGSDVLISGGGADTLWGWDGDDILFGDHAELLYSNGALGSATSILTATGADDVLHGERGNDTLVGGIGADVLFGWIGNDALVGDNAQAIFSGANRISIASTSPANGAADTLWGWDGNDLLIGGTNTDTIHGEAGNDILIGDQAIATYTNGALTAVTTTDGNAAEYASDTLTSGSGDNILVGGLGADTLQAAEGNDLLIGDQATVTLTVAGVWTEASSQDHGRGASDTLNGAAGNDVLIGGFDADTITAGAGADLVLGDNGSVTRTSFAVLIGAATTAPSYGAADTVHGNEGNDIILSGAGSDSVFGNDGDDVLLGDQGSVSFTNGDLTFVTTTDGALAEVGDDTINSGEGNNIVLGGLGSDEIVTLSGADLVFGDQGSVKISSTGVWHDSLSHDTARGGADTINAGSGDDTVIAGQGNDVANGEAGADLIIGDNGQILRTPAGLLDFVTSTATADGSADILNGGAAADVLVGGADSDLIDGESGDDIAIGDSAQIDYLNSVLVTIRTISPSIGASDTISTAEGNDIVLGGAAGDLLNSGNDNDILVGDQGLLTYTNGYLVQITSTDNQLTEVGGDVISAGEGDNVVIAGLGDDTITTQSGTDLIAGDQATLNIHEAGVWFEFVSHDTERGGSDTIHAGNGSDVVLAGCGEDLVLGQAGDDTLIGDNGRILRQANAWLAIIETSAPLFGSSDILHGQDGNDIILGGTAGDSIASDAGNDIIIGDQGKLSYSNGHLTEITNTDGDAQEAAGDTISAGEGDNVVFGGLGNDSIITLSGADIIAGDQATLTITEAGVWTKLTSHDVSRGGDDMIATGAGADIVLAGYAQDTVSAEANADIVIGDNGELNRTSTGLFISMASVAPEQGAADLLNGNEGDDIVIGGAAGDHIEAHSGNDIVIGDQGLLTYTNGHLTQITTTDGTLAEVGADTINAEEGSNIVFGGLGSDSIATLTGADIIVADQGTLNILETGVWTSLVTHDFARGGDDVIFSGAGEDIVLAGFGHDTITAEEGSDLVIGDNGSISRLNNGWLSLIQTTAPSIGSPDEIHGNAGDDIILGGTASDTITGDANSDIIVGDQGQLTYTNGKLTQLTTTDGLLSEVGDDSINAGEGDNIVFAGLGSDAIVTLSGSDIVAGDQATLNILQSGIWTELVSHDFARGGADVVFSGAGDDIVLGGFGSDTITAQANNDVVLGDNASILRHNNGARSIITTIQPTIGSNDTIFGNEGDDLIFGGTLSDTISAGSEKDLVFGDHGRIDYSLPANDNFRSIDTQSTDLGAADFIHGDAGDDIILGGQGDDVVYGDADDDDIIGGHNVVLGHDEIEGVSGFNDKLDGGTGNDVIAGDNAWIIRRGDSVTSRVRVLLGNLLYSTDGSAAVAAQAQAIPTGAASRDIILLDHSITPAAMVFGNDVIAGGAHDDLIFGQLGNEIIQGDSSIDHDAANASVTAANDGDDYIEGNGGDDRIYGNEGQDDIIGGNSDLFGLTTPAQRPDGGDLIFGGSGIDLARNTVGASGVNAHSRDADMVLGDNGRIFRPIGKGSASGAFLTFNYDNYGGTIRIIPRAIDLIDYTANGVASDDIGAGDVIHGEAGDDILHGASGNDVIYGEGQDDDLYGESGNDWLSGGTGEDGILGDDGKILTSRNGIAEPLYGLVAVAQSSIQSKSMAASYILNATGRLNKAVDLEPFDIGGNDLIYGGLGDDFLHGGAGDDGISGAEALDSIYVAPSTARAIVYDATVREFTDYNENNALLKVAGHALNFEAFVGATTNKVNDGNDVLFGDLGNDWLVGGTNSDHMFGGLGDDLLNSDDNLETNGGLNDAPDAGLYGDADLAYGGGGLDYMLGNTGADRMVDSHGEFNSYVVPFSPYGAATIIRALNPDTRDLLYAVSKSDGADQTRTGGGLGTPARNGEPYGELGLVMQGDPQAGDQTGAPSDPQPGNGKSSKDVRR